MGSITNGYRRLVSFPNAWSALSLPVLLLSLALIFLTLSIWLSLSRVMLCWLQSDVGAFSYMAQQHTWS